MKKKALLAAVLLGVAVLTLTVASPTFAAEPARGGPGGGGGAGGNGGGGNRQQGTIGTGTGIPVEQNINLDGIFSDLIHANLSSALGITPEELAARLDAGETISAIALSLGFDPAAISDILMQSRTDALAQAVADGVITQEQADWWSSHGNQAPAANYVDGVCDGTGDCVVDGAALNGTQGGRGKGYGK